MTLFTDYYTGLAAGALSDAGKIAVTDTNSVYTSTNVDGVLDEIITAKVSATGRVAVAGVEVGDTGWRTVSPVNDWTGTIHLRRTGYMVHIRHELVGSAPATSSTFYSLTSGFTLSTTVGRFYWPVSSNSTASNSGNIKYAGMFGGSTARLIIGDWVSGTAYGYASYPTDDAWPSSLPGSAV